MQDVRTYEIMFPDDQRRELPRGTNDLLLNEEVKEQMDLTPLRI